MAATDNIPSFIFGSGEVQKASAWLAIIAVEGGDTNALSRIVGMTESDLSSFRDQAYQDEIIDHQGRMSEEVVRYIREKFANECAALEASRGTVPAKGNAKG